MNTATPRSDEQNATSNTPRADAVISGNVGHVDRTTEQSLAYFARCMETENRQQAETIARLREALIPFANLDTSVASGLWAINLDYCEAARAALVQP